MLNSNTKTSKMKIYKQIKWKIKILKLFTLQLIFINYFYIIFHQKKHSFFYILFLVISYTKCINTVNLSYNLITYYTWTNRTLTIEVIYDFQFPQISKDLGFHYDPYLFPDFPRVSSTLFFFRFIFRRR